MAGNPKVVAVDITYVTSTNLDIYPSPHELAPATVDASSAGPVPVFVDESGRRGRRVLLFGLVLGSLLLGFIVAVGVAVVTPSVDPGGHLSTVHLVAGVPHPHG